MEDQYIIVLITTPSKEVGEQISNVLLEKKLAACVNMLTPINSLYSWQGTTARDEETLLVVKSKAGLFQDQLVPVVQSIHPYEVPEIIALPILMGSASYLDWIDAETQAT